MVYRLKRNTDAQAYTHAYMHMHACVAQTACDGLSQTFSVACGASPHVPFNLLLYAERLE